MTAQDRSAFKVGDVIAKSEGDPRGDYRTIIRLITEVRPTGYTWEYLEHPLWPTPLQDFWSENSCDAFFEMGWVLVLRGGARP